MCHVGSPFFIDSKDEDLGGGDHGRLLLGTAVSLARRLGLHHLTHDATVDKCAFLQDTSFFIDGPSSLHFELGRRLWWSLVALDAKSCTGGNDERHIPMGSCTLRLSVSSFACLI